MNLHNLRSIPPGIAPDTVIRLGLLPAVVAHAHIAGATGLLFGPDCLFRCVLGRECWGCGMTRALDQLCHLEWQAALLIHPLSPAVLALLATLFLCELLKLHNRLKGGRNG